MKRIYIIFAMVLLSILTISNKNGKDYTISVNEKKQTLIIETQINSELNIQNVKIIKENKVLIETPYLINKSSSIVIPITSLSPGIYFVRIQTTDTIEIQRIIIS